LQRRVTALAFCALASLAGARVASAQHATAYDVEDGARTFASTCANCHGPDGNLIPGIDLGHGQFRRALTDRELENIIENGIPNTAMPPSPLLTEDAVQRLVAFLRSNAEQKPAPGKNSFSNTSSSSAHPSGKHCSLRKLHSAPTSETP